MPKPKTHRASFDGLLARAPILGAAFLLVQAPGFAQQQAPTPKAFDVASVKLNRSGGFNSGMRTEHGHMIATNVTVRMLIQSAFRVRDFQISGGPEWLDTERYDVDAKTERAGVSDDDLWQSLQPLLAERFQLKVHREVKQFPVYLLVVGKGAPKLHAHTADNKQRMGFSASSGKAKLTSTQSMPEFAGSLGSYLDRPVLDRTGLQGVYEVRLEWSLDRPGARPPSSPESPREETGLTGASIFTAVQEQLGLRLQSGKGPVETIVVDHAEKASAN